MDDSGGSVGSKGLAERFCPDGAGANTRKACLVDEWFGVNCLVESESKGGALGGGAG